jgi:hypothetical protein
MKNPGFTERNTVVNKMQVDLDVLCSLMLNWVGGHLGRTDIVTVNYYGFLHRLMKFRGQLTKPDRLGDNICNRAVLSFCT